MGHQQRDPNPLENRRDPPHVQDPGSEILAETDEERHHWNPEQNREENELKNEHSWK